MYSGAVVIFGVKFACEKDLVEALDLDYYDHFQYCISIPRLAYDKHYDDLRTHVRLRELDARLLRVFCLPCCLTRSNPSVFVGIYIGSKPALPTETCMSFDNFASYCADYESRLEKMKECAKDIPMATYELKMIFPDKTPKIYTFADDCDSCT